MPIPGQPPAPQQAPQGAPSPAGPGGPQQAGPSPSQIMQSLMMGADGMAKLAAGDQGGALDAEDHKLIGMIQTATHALYSNLSKGQGQGQAPAPKAAPSAPMAPNQSAKSQPLPQG